MGDIKIIGIAGGTGSGKSTLSRKIKEALKESVVLICHDNYYKDSSHLPFEKIGGLLWNTYIFSAYLLVL